MILTSKGRAGVYIFFIEVEILKLYQIYICYCICSCSSTYLKSVILTPYVPVSLSHISHAFFLLGCRNLALTLLGVTLSCTLHLFITEHYYLTISHRRRREYRAKKNMLCARVMARENEVLNHSARAIFDNHQCNFTKIYYK